MEDIKFTHDVGNWEAMIHREHFSWAGWVARLAHFDPNRPTFRVLTHKLHRDVVRRAKERGRENRPDQGHGRRLHVWQWERALFKLPASLTHGEYWLEAALDPRAWAKSLDQLVAHRSKHR